MENQKLTPQQEITMLHKKALGKMPVSKGLQLIAIAAKDFNQKPGINKKHWLTCTRIISNSILKN